MITRKIPVFALALACVTSAMAQERFNTPEAAAQAVIEAAGNHDSNRLTAIFGPAAKGVLTSGNTAQDQNEQSEFARLARDQHRIQVSPMNANRAILVIGDQDWPFPVPMLKKDSKWAFDASQAPMEMRARRIGTDELDAVEICRGYVAAQKKYAATDWDKDGLLEYAPHLMSSPGKQDGLYWPNAGEALIPERMALAENARSGKPYHGYYFRVLDAQGPDAHGGAHAYLIKDQLIGGFGLVAWPAEYGVTGIHTFIVNQDGVVYEKDIAPAPGKGIMPITLFNPDHSWQPME